MDYLKTVNGVLIGYSTNSWIELNDEERELNEEEDEFKVNSTRESFDIKWDFTLFNGIFTDNIEIKLLRF